MLRGFTAQAALDAPRFCISAGLPDSEQAGDAGDVNSEVYFEEGIAPGTVAKLRGQCLDVLFKVLPDVQAKEMGHDARFVSGFGRGMMGRGQIIQKLVDISGRTVWAAGSDPRADGHAAAQI